MLPDGVAFRRAQPGGGELTGEVTATLSSALSSRATIPVTLTAHMAEEDDFRALAGITINADSTTGRAR